MVLLHKSSFASKWMQALQLSFGDSFSKNKTLNAFALLYVMYNPVSRGDIRKKTSLSNRMLAEALHPLHKEYAGQSKFLWFYIKAAWVVLKFRFTNRALADCNPTLIMTASQQPDAAVFKDVSRMLMLVKNYKRDAKTDWKFAQKEVVSMIKLATAFGGIKLPSNNGSLQSSVIPAAAPRVASSTTWLQKMKNCCRTLNRVFPKNPDHDQFYNDVPKLFVDRFALKREFVAGIFDEEVRLSLVTLFMFSHDQSLESSRECQQYQQKFDSNLESFQKSFRVLFRLSKDLEFANSSKKCVGLARGQRIIQSVSDLVFGGEMKLLRNFHRLADDEAVELFRRHDFPEAPVDCLKVLTVDEVLKQLLAAHPADAAEASEQGNHAQISKEDSYPNTLMSFTPAPKVNEASQDSGDNQAPPTTRRSRPQVYATKEMRSAMEAGHLFSAASTAQPQSAPESDSIESLRLTFEKQISDLKEAMITRDKELSAKDLELSAKDRDISEKDKELSAKDREISALQALTTENTRIITAKDSEISEKDREISAKDNEISALQALTMENKRTMTAKDREISALQALTTSLMNKSNALGLQLAAVSANAAASDLPSDIQRQEETLQSQNRSRALFLHLQEMQRASQAEIQSLRDAGAAPEVIRAKMRAAEDDLLLAMAAD